MKDTVVQYNTINISIFLARVAQWLARLPQRYSFVCEIAAQGFWCPFWCILLVPVHVSPGCSSILLYSNTKIIPHTL